MRQLPLEKYASLIHLYETFKPYSLDLQRKEDVVAELIADLIDENERLRNVEIPQDDEGKRHLLRALLTTRNPLPMENTFLEKLDSLLLKELSVKDIVEVERLPTASPTFLQNPANLCDTFAVWQGDITRLRADAIVNAANEYLLGCFQPYHACIDNAIHAAAGPRLREDCDTIMSVQGETEATGGAKITRGYHLPSKYVLHTVGPIIPKGTKPKEQQKKQLAFCYRSCLDLAKEIPDIQTVAFCAISTGVFGFPKPEAARIALITVNDWLIANPHRFKKIVFNVFGEEDYNEYRKVFSV